METEDSSRKSYFIAAIAPVKILIRVQNSQNSVLIPLQRKLLLDGQLFLIVENIKR